MGEVEERRHLLCSFDGLVDGLTSLALIVLPEVPLLLIPLVSA